MGQFLWSEVGQCNFSPFLDTDHLFALKISFHYDKQLHHWKSEFNTKFLNQGFVYHPNQIKRLEFLQHSGNGIRVNTWTDTIKFPVFCVLRPNAIKDSL